MLSRFSTLEHTGAGCEVCRAGRALGIPDPDEGSGGYSQRGDAFRVEAQGRYCRGCGALEDWCRCGGMAYR
jgi:hypothetical protein